MVSWGVVVKASGRTIQCWTGGGFECRVGGWHMPLRRGWGDNRRGAAIIVLGKCGLIFTSLKAAAAITRVVAVVKFVISPIPLGFGVRALAKRVK